MAYGLKACSCHPLNLKKVNPTNLCDNEKHLVKWEFAKGKFMSLAVASHI